MLDTRLLKKRIILEWKTKVNQMAYAEQQKLRTS
jgi:hypothetical protein